MTDLRERVQTIFSVFEDDDLVLSDEMTAEDVEDWDLLAHINLIIAIEQKLGIKFATAEISRLKEPGENVGSFLRLIEGKVARS